MKTKTNQKNTNIETEIKIKIDNPNTFISELIEKKAVFKGKDFQRTIRMDTPNMDLQKKGIFLRVCSGLGNAITLKVKKEENKDFKLRDEYETKVEDINVLSRIFSILGFSKHFVMEKYRANFLHKNVMISIDELPFGIYVEFEGEPKDINSVVKELGFENSERITATYWHLFDNYLRKNNLSGENIIFPKNYKSQIMDLEIPKSQRKDI